MKHLGTTGHGATERIAVEDVALHPLKALGAGGSLARRARQPPHGSAPGQEGCHEPATDEPRPARDEDRSRAQIESRLPGTGPLRRRIRFIRCEC